MNRKFTKFLAIFTSILYSNVLCAEERWPDILADITAEGFDGWKSEQIVGYAEINANAVGVPSYTKGVLLLWINREFSHLELLWWKSEDPEKRELILSCFYLLTDENGDFRNSPNWPVFTAYALRFSAEKEARQTEIVNAQQASQKLKKTLRDTVETMKNDLASALHVPRQIEK